MSDYIKREDAIDALYGYGKSAQDIIKRIPAADVVEQKRGRWIPSKEPPWLDCSECGQDSVEYTNYCPNCGADMRGEYDEKA